MLELSLLHITLKDGYVDLPTRRKMQERYAILIDEFKQQYKKLPNPSIKDPLTD